MRSFNDRSEVLFGALAIPLFFLLFPEISGAEEDELGPAPSLPPADSIIS